MSDLSWLDELRQAYPQLSGLLGSLEPTEKDKSKALNNSLLTAGAAILAANNGRGPASAAIGQGLLGGIQSYQGTLDSQRKDAIQRMQGITGLLGLGGQLQGMDDLKELKSYLGPQQAPMPQSTSPDAQIAPPGNMPPGMAPPQGGGLYGIPPEALRFSLSRNPQVAAVGKEIFERAKPMNLTAGATVGGYNAQGQFVPSYTAPRLPESAYVDPAGSVNMLPGAQSAIEAAANAQAAGTAKAQAAQDVITVKEGGRERPVVRSQFIAEQQGGVPSQLAAAYADYVKSGSNLPFQFIPPSKANPTKAEEAAAVQSAQIPGQLQEAAGKALLEKQAATLDKGYEAATVANEQLASAYEARKQMQSGAFTGGGAQAKTAALNMINGLTGLNIGVQDLSNTQALGSALGSSLLAQAKQLGSNPSEGDAKRIEKIVGTEGLSERALQMIIDFREKHAMRVISLHNSRAEQAEKSGNKQLFSYRVDPVKPEAVTSAETPVNAQPLQQNTTAIYKAQQAIKAGADPKAVRQRLIESGYNPAGL